MYGRAESHFVTTRRTQVDKTQKTKHKAQGEDSEEREFAMQARGPEIKSPAPKGKSGMAARIYNSNAEEQRLLCSRGLTDWPDSPDDTLALRFS